ncbi:MAG: cyclic nucleotide-gated ion channel/potassium channel family protein [Acetobacteraceae bacterium]|nr:cyclic nucleotide-gated ion channel/potassium channel family protein [Acetobacteraceae bacterium]
MAWTAWAWVAREKPWRRAGVTHAARVLLVLSAVVLATLATDHAIDESGGLLLDSLLVACVLGMLADWLGRAWQARRAEGGVQGYLTSGFGVLDAIAALAVPLAFLIGARDDPLWLFGGLWVLKLVEAAPRLGRLGRVLKREVGSLLAVAALGAILLFLSAAAVHGLEGSGNPEGFGTIPRTLWWGINTVTGVGIEAAPESVPGRLIAGGLMVLGLGVFGLWAGILASGFTAEGRREEFLGSWELVCRVPFLKAMGPAAIADLAGALRRVDVPESTVVVRRGQRGECMYFVAEGEVEVEVPTGPVTLAEGSFFGELALLEGGSGVRNATVRCKRPASLLVLDVADFRALLARHPTLATMVEEEAARRRVG